MYDPQNCGFRYDRQRWNNILLKVLPRYYNKLRDDQMSQRDWENIQRDHFRFPYGAPTADAIRLYYSKKKEDFLGQIAAQIPTVAYQSLVRVSIAAMGNFSLTIQTDPTVSPPPITSPTGVLSVPARDNREAVAAAEAGKVAVPGPSNRPKRKRRISRDLLSPDRFSPRPSGTRSKKKFCKDTA